MNINTDNRDNRIIRYNALGIAMNIILSTFKMIIGSIYNAHALIMDGVNGFSDATSFLLSILSSILNKKGGSKELPMGYGRLEYLFSLTTTILVMYVGIRSIISAVGAILDPHEAPDYSISIIIVTVVSLFLKLGYGILCRQKGKELGSIAMIMNGTDSLCDSLISVAILAAIVIYKMTNVDIEHYLCIIISLMIIFTGVKMLHECTNKILGARVDPDFKKQITNMIIQEEEVLNVSNLVIHNYGENVNVGSVDIEVDPEMKAIRITELSRKIIGKAEELGLKLTSVGINASDLHDSKADFMYDRIIDRAMQQKGIIRINSFSVDFEKRAMSFYIVVDYHIKDKEAEKKQLLEEVKKMYPDMDVNIYVTVDM